MAWTLEYDGVEKELSAWGISGLSRQQVSQDQGGVTFTIPGTVTTPPFDHRAEVIVRKSRTGSGTTWSAGVVWFVGYVRQIAEAARGSSEAVTVQLSDAWWHLENKVYEQAFKTFAGWVDDIPGGTVILEDKSTSHIVLNLDIDGGVWGTRAQLEDILDWAIAQGAPISYTADTFPDINIPCREERDLTCAEAIRRQLAYMDAVTWFDFTTTPPALRIARRSALTGVNVAATACSGVSVTPRHDIRVPAVRLMFEKSYVDTGGSFMQTVMDSYPDPLPADTFGELAATIVLAPSQSVSVSQEIEVGALSPSTTAFWNKVKPETADADLFADFAVVSSTVKDMNGNICTLPNYVIEGQIATWMDVDYASVIVTAEVSFTVKETLPSTDKITLAKSRKKKLTFRCIATDGETGLYADSAVVDPGEDPTEFAGLAQEIYTDLNALNHDGQLTIAAEEVAGTVGMGNKVSITGGPTAWASIAAPVQGVTEDVESGRTTVNFGVNKHLGPGELLDLLRVNRTRQFTRYNSRNSGSFARANDVTLPSVVKSADTTEAESLTSESSVSDRDSAGKTPTVQLQAKETTSQLPVIQLYRLGTTGVADVTVGKILLELSRAMGKEIKLREAKVCTPTATGYCIVLASEMYTEALLIGDETPLGDDPPA